MILEIALGIVLAVLILALLPIVVVGSIVALRWLIPALLVVGAIWFLVKYPAQLMGTAGIIILALIILASWLILPTKLGSANGFLARKLVAAHSIYFALLDKKPPFTTLKWMPLRLAALLLAIVSTTLLAAVAFIALSVVWAQ